MNGNAGRGSVRRNRSGLLGAPIALVVALSAIVAATVASMVVVAEPAPAVTPTVAPTVAPATVYSSIASCTVGFAPSVFSSADSVTMSTTFSPTGTSYRVGADALGPDFASVLLDATSSPNSPSLTGSAIDAMIGLASGAHSVEFYAVDATGAAVGAPVCTATYTYDGPISSPVLTGATELRGQVGVSLDAGTGAFTYTPTLAGSPHPTGCTVDLGSAGFSASDLKSTRDLGDGLWFAPSDSTSECGTIRGTPTRAGTYTFRQTLTACLGNCGIIVGPISVSSTEAEAQTFAWRRTLTLVVEPATSPVFTG